MNQRLDHTRNEWDYHYKPKRFYQIYLKFLFSVLTYSSKFFKGWLCYLFSVNSVSFCCNLLFWKSVYFSYLHVTQTIMSQIYLRISPSLDRMGPKASRSISSSFLRTTSFFHFMSLSVPEMLITWVLVLGVSPRMSWCFNYSSSKLVSVVDDIC